MMHRRRSAAAGCVLVLIVTACGVPTGPDSFEPINDADVPNRLNETTTTTTTTTSVPAPTTLPDQTETTTTTTTIPEIQTEQRDVYFISRGQLQPSELEIDAPVTANDLIVRLESGPNDDLLDNEIDRGLIESATRSGGVLTIDLDDRVFRRIAIRRQPLAIAQMVLTFLSGLTGVGQAVFTLEGDVLSVPIGNGDFTEDPVALDDYQSMLVDSAPTPTTTTTVPPTTVAPTTAPPTTGAPSTDPPAATEVATTTLP